MNVKDVYVYIHKGFADWEPAFVLPELQRDSRYRVKTVAETSAPVVSMGGLRVLPDLVLDDLDPDKAAILILTGGESWLDAASHAPVMGILPRFRERRVLLAAICGATLAPARLGYLDNIRHTSNDQDFLKTFAAAYAGEGNYAGGLAVTDAGIITASGSGAIEFAREILGALGVHDQETLRHWYDLFKNAVMPPPEFWAHLT